MIYKSMRAKFSLPTLCRAGGEEEGGSVTRSRAECRLGLSVE